MMFRRTIYSALIVGLLAGLMLSLFQVLSVNPIIFEAEGFELEGTHDHGAYNHGSHEHSEDAWAPADGLERTGYTVISNILAGIGFALVLLSVMSQVQLQGMTQVSRLKGLVWGSAGFLVFFLAPAIGLPPEIPGIEASPLEHRQSWWILTVIAVALGLMVLFFAPLKFKIAGVMCLVFPYLTEIPHAQGPAFIHPDPQAVATLTRLHQEFILASGVSNLAFWLVLGVISAWLLNKWILKDMNNELKGDSSGA